MRKLLVGQDFLPIHSMVTLSQISMDTLLGFLSLKLEILPFLGAELQDKLQPRLMLRN